MAWFRRHHVAVFCMFSTISYDNVFDRGSPNPWMKVLNFMVSLFNSLTRFPPRTGIAPFITREGVLSRPLGPFEVR